MVGSGARSVRKGLREYEVLGKAKAVVITSAR